MRFDFGMRRPVTRSLTERIGLLLLGIGIVLAYLLRFLPFGLGMTE